MAHATIVIHGELNDFLPQQRRGAAIERPLHGRPAVKDMLEALGIPHPKIAALEVNGRPVSLAHRLRPGDRVEAWPAPGPAGSDREAAPAVDSGEAAPAVDPGEAEDPRFVVDGHLGRLAAYLRMAGFDTWYRNRADDDELAAVAAADDRILLTRDRGLLKRSIVRRGRYVRSDRPVEQLVEVTRRFDLVASWQPFGRCLRCNTVLDRVSRADVLDRLEPLTRRYYDDFRRCPGCGAVYWKGSHHARMERLLDRVRSRVAGEAER